MSKTKQGEGKRSKAGRGEEKGNRAGGAEFGDVVAVGDTACVWRPRCYERRWWIVGRLADGAVAAVGGLAKNRGGRGRGYWERQGEDTVKRQKIWLIYLIAQITSP